MLDYRMIAAACDENAPEMEAILHRLNVNVSPFGLMPIGLRFPFNQGYRRSQSRQFALS
jgi:hypothetical protein